MNIKRVGGFTIMELIVSLTISSLVILAAVRFLSSYEGLISKRNRSLEEAGGILQLYNVMARDMKRCDKAISAPGGIIMSTGKDRVIYEFNEKNLIRISNEVSDTFNFYKVTMTSNMEPIMGFIGTLSVEISIENRIYPLIIEKTYPGDILMNALIFSE